jgi:hypothetical protein
MIGYARAPQLSRTRNQTLSDISEMIPHGLLLSYRPNFPDYFRKTVGYVDKSLKGARPADLPIEQPTRFRLVINLKTARALSLSVPNSVLITADEDLGLITSGLPQQADNLRDRQFCGRWPTAPKAANAIRAADRAQPEVWSIQMEDHGRPAQLEPNIAQWINGGYGWLEVECHRCKTRASLPLDAIQRPRDTPIWKLYAARKCRSCKKGRCAPPVHMIKLTQEREITPYVWVRPDEER